MLLLAGTCLWLFYANVKIYIFIFAETGAPANRKGRGSSTDVDCRAVSKPVRELPGRWGHLIVMAKPCLGGMTMVIYCLFCEPGKGEYVCRAATALFDCRAIYPRQVQHRRKDAEKSPNKRNGKHEEYRNVERDLLPGYAFLYFESEPPVVGSLNRMDGVIRCLSDSSGKYELTGSDEAFAKMLLDKNGIIGKTMVYQEGDRIRICEGAFKNVQATILKVNHRTNLMQVEILFAGQPVKTWLEYETVESMSANP